MNDLYNLLEIYINNINKSRLTCSPNKNNINRNLLLIPLNIKNIFNINNTSSLCIRLDTSYYNQYNSSCFICIIGKYDEKDRCLSMIVSNDSLPSIDVVEQHNCYSTINKKCGFKLYFKILYYFLSKILHYNGSLILTDMSEINGVRCLPIRLLRNEGSIYNSVGFRFNITNNIDNITVNHAKYILLPFSYNYMNIETYITKYFKQKNLYNNDTSLLLTYLKYIIIYPYEINNVTDNIINIIYKNILKYNNIHNNIDIFLNIKTTINNIAKTINNAVDYQSINININNTKNDNTKINNNNINNTIKYINDNIMLYLSNNIFYVINKKFNIIDNLITSISKKNINNLILSELNNEYAKFIFNYSITYTNMICDNIQSVNILCT